MPTDLHQLLDQARQAARPADPTPTDLPAGLLARLATLPATDPGLPAAVGRYLVSGLLGRGGMGAVYAATDPELGRPVAVKVMTAGRFADPLARDRFRREGAAVARLRHDHVVPVYAAESPPDGPQFLVMPRVDGPTLAQAVRADGGMPPLRAAEVCRQVADALAAAHAAGLVHRDVKPSNVLLDNADGRAKLTDFGLVRGVEPGTTATVERSGLSGTPEYLAPEQASDPERADPRSDVYSLGVTLYECLTGVAPFRGPLLEVLDRHASEEPVPPGRLAAGVPRDLETVCLKCLEKNPVRRYQSAAALRDDLRRFLADEPVRARPLGPVGRGWRWTRRHPLPVALLLVTMLGAGGSAAGWRRAWVKADEAEQNASTAVTSAAEADARSRDADAARADAQKQATLADERAVMALKAMNTLVIKAQELPDATPGSLALKRKLTEAGLADLRKLTARAVVPGAELAAVDAHLTLGDTLSTLGRTDDALVEWDKGRQRAEAAVAGPTTLRANQFAARAHQSLGFTKNLLGRFPEATAHYAAAISLLEAVVAATPNDPYPTASLGAALNGRADLRRATSDPAALADQLRALELAERAARLEPTFEQFQRNLPYCHTRIGYAHLSLLRDHVSAEPHFRASRDIAAAALKRLPDDQVWEREYVGAVLGLAMAVQRAGRFDEAEALSKEGIRLLETAATAAPDNGNLLRRLGTAYCHLAWVEQGRGRDDASDALQGKAIEQFRRVAERTKNPALVIGDLPPSYYQRFVLSFRRGRFAEAADRVDDWSEANFRQYPALRASKDATDYVRDLKAAVRLVPDAVADPAVIAAQPKGVADLLALYRADVLARTGDLSTARREVAALAAARPTDPAALGQQAAILGMSAAASADPAERERYTLAGVEALLAAMKLNPSLAVTAHMNPDWNPVRWHPTFLTRLKAIFAPPASATSK